MFVFVLFVFGAVVLGAGAMLAPALPLPPALTRQRAAPRVGLAAILALAVIVAGALFLAALFGWDSLTLDYLLFALLVSIFLGGTLALGTRRGEAAGLADHEIGWPGRRELVFFAVAAALFTLPIFLLPVPLDTDAQGFGYLALMLRQSGSLTTLAPFHPEIEYLYSPGFPALTAYLSQQLNAGLHTVQFVVAAVLAVLFLWLLFDLGNEVEDWLDESGRQAAISGQLSAVSRQPPDVGGQTLAPRHGEGAPPIRHAGAALALMGLLGTGLFTAYMDSHFTTIMALGFALGFVIFITRYLRGERWPDALFAAVCLSAVPLTHPDTTIVLILGYAPWLATIWLARPRPSLKAWLVMAVVVPLLALLGISPWLARIAPLLGSSIASPFEIDPNHWRVLLFFHGGLIVPLALGGAVIALRRRTPLDVLMVGWLLLVIDFSTTGVLARLLPGLLAPLLKYDYPFSIAWHGPIIPYAYLSARLALWLAGRIGWARVRRWIDRLAWPALGLAAAGLILAAVFAGPLLRASKGLVSFYGAFSSAADVQAMVWLRDNTPPEARILNHPGPHEADWAPIIAERDTVYFRPQPFFRHTARAEAEQAALLAFWQNPTDPANADLLQRHRIDYVLVPQVVADPDSLAGMWRWRAPFTQTLDMRSAVADAPYLRLVADFDGAQVYAVVGE